MDILITGSNGFLGKILYNKLSQENNVFGLARSNSNFNFDLIKKFNGFNKKFDLVIHAAGKAHSKSNQFETKNNFYEVNVIGTKNLLTGLEISGIPKYLIFISSVSVYGIENGEKIKESFPINAKDPYGVSKILAEKTITSWCQKNQVICTILRLPLVVGQNPPGNLGSMINSIKKGFYFNIAGGNAKKSMVLAEDVAKSILNVAEVGGIYNLTDGNHPSFAELSNHISIQLGKGKPRNMPLWLAKTIAKFGDLLGSNAPLNTNKLNKITLDLTFDDTKANISFGWRPTPVLEGFTISQ